jgi:hypothetical protein
VDRATGCYDFAFIRTKKAAAQNDLGKAAMTATLGTNEKGGETSWFNPFPGWIGDFSYRNSFDSLHPAIYLLGVCPRRVRDIPGRGSFKLSA